VSALAGTGALARLAVRRDRFRLPVWVLLAVGVVAGTASSIRSLYPTPDSRARYAVGKSAASAVLGGPGYGLGNQGGIVVNESAATVLILVALVSIMLVVRHTRREEETGRAELVGAGAVGWHARLASALLVAAAVAGLVGAGMVAVLVGSGLPVAGSVAFGLAVAGTGAFFAAVAGVTAQVAAHARGANGSAVAVFGLAFLLRAVGDASAVGGHPLRYLSWLSPLGWAQQVRAYDGERWWVLGLLAGAALGVAGGAAALSGRRDLGAGLVPDRPGPGAAAARLAGPGALAWRLQRAGLAGWVAGIVVGAAVFGAIARDIGAMAARDASAARALEKLGGAGGPVDSYLAWVLGLAGLAAAGYGVAAVLRARSEETAGRAELVLATSVTRIRWLAGHVVCAAAGTVAVLGAAGAALGLAHGLRSGAVSTEVPRLVVAALVQAPAVAVLAAVAVALVGLAPRATVAAWGYLVAAALVGQLGGVLRLPGWVVGLSPFRHLPKVPAEHVTAGWPLWLAGLAVCVAAAGLLGFRRRDVPAG
jgi:ABC-2 type transport system permease protein